MWRYSKKDGWEEIEDFLAATGSKEIADEFHACGFSSEPTFEIGDSDELGAEIYRRLEDVGHSISYVNYRTLKPLTVPKATEAKDEFLANIFVGGRSYPVALPALPDLLDFLSQFTSICRGLGAVSPSRSNE